MIDSAGDYPGTGTSGEVAWGEETQSGFEGGGGGLSANESEPSWQSGVVPASMDPDDARAVPDVSMDSGSAQEYDVFTSTLSANTSSENTTSGEAVGWLGDAGTSGAAPIWAGLIAIADQGRVLAGGTPLTGYTQTLPALYALPAADFHDIVNGSNGYAAEPGYDLATGRGTPIANLLVPALAGYEVASQIAIKTEPPSSVVAGNTFGLTVQVDDSLGNAVNGGTVTVALGNNPGGAILEGIRTATVVDGVATFSGLILSEPGTGYTLTVTDGGLAGSQTTSPITVTAHRRPGCGDAQSQQLERHLRRLAPNRPGHHQPRRTARASPSSIQQNGVTVTNPTHAGDYSVTATLDNPNYTAPAVTGTLVIDQATPTLTWTDPGISPSAPHWAATSSTRAPSFNGTPLSGSLTYTPGPAPCCKSATASPSR